VTGRINAVSDTLSMSKARLHESIASLEIEAGIGRDAAAMTDFDQYKDDMPVVGNTKTGQPVIDLMASASNTLTRSATARAGGSPRANTNANNGRAELSPSAKLFNSFFGCCATTRK
jgi:hypothetical protein